MRRSNLLGASHDLIGADLWPPNSPNLNPVYFKIWRGDELASVSNAETRFSRIEAAFDRQLVRAAAERYGRRY